MPVVGWAQQGLACCTTGSDGGDEPRRPTGSVGAVRHGWCVACRVKLGRRRTPGCWHREAWLCLSWDGHSKGWPAAPPAATAATSRGGPPAASGRFGTGGVWRAGLSWAGGAHLVAGTGRPGCACRGPRHSKGWPAAPPAAYEPRRPTGSVGAVRHGWCVACRVKLGRRRTPGCWHREAWLCLSWAGHSKGWPAAPPAATAATSRGGPPAASGRFGTGGVWRAGLSWAGGAHLVAGTGRPGCACRGMGTARAGLLHHRRRRAAAAHRQRRGGSARVVCGVQG